MRGNERTAASNTTRRHSTFPIPMRGNENGVLLTAGAAVAAEFPIPMRGNELGLAFYGGLRAAEVSNPHEG